MSIFCYDMSRREISLLNTFLASPTFENAMKEVITIYQTKQKEERKRVALLSPARIKKAINASRIYFQSLDLNQCGNFVRVCCDVAGVCSHTQKSGHRWLASIITKRYGFTLCIPTVYSMSNINIELLENKVIRNTLECRRDCKNDIYRIIEIQLTNVDTTIRGYCQVYECRQVLYQIIRDEHTGSILRMKFVYSRYRSGHICKNEIQACVDVFRIYFFVRCVRRLAARKYKKHVMEQCKERVLGNNSIDPILKIIAEYAVDYRC